MTLERTRILDLARQIVKLAESLVQHLEEQQLPEPSYEASYRAPETPEFETLLSPLNEVTHDFLRLINGPKRFMTSQLLAHYDLAAYQVALEFNFFEAIPIGHGKSMHLKELAKTVDIDEDRVGRIMRFLATQKVFEEAQTNVFRHTSNSALFATDADLKAAGLMQ